MSFCSVFYCQIDEPNDFGNTALHVACYMGQEAVATELVNHGANVNQPNKCGYTPLHLAAVSTNGALCLELLVNNGADVNQQVAVLVLLLVYYISLLLKVVKLHIFIKGSFARVRVGIVVDGLIRLFDPLAILTT